MKKNIKRFAGIVLITMSMFCLTACAEKTQSETGENTEEVTEVALTEEIQTRPEEFVQPSEKVLKEILDSTLDWAGMLYTSEKIEIAQLTMQEAVPMVGQAIASKERENPTDIPYDEMNGIYTIDKSVFDRQCKNYFGKTFETTGLDTEGTYGNYLVQEGTDGGITVSVGDWGIVAPVYSISEVTSGGDDQWVVSVDYATYSQATEEETEAIYHINYTITKDENSDFGYIITEIEGYSL